MLTDLAREHRPSPELAWVDRRSPELGELLRSQSGVVDVRTAQRCLAPAALRWRLDSGRWQRPCRGILVAHSGPLSAEQALWVAVCWAGSGALLAGLTAGRLDGLSGFDDRRIHVLLPAARQVRKERPPFPVIVHRSTLLGPADIHPARWPPRTRLARSLVDAAAWMATDDRARAVLAAGVQQRIVDAATWWKDMRRDNEFTASGYRVLRFPAFAIRCQPDEVARQIREALRLGAGKLAQP